ncbi:MAG TPA: fructosamine kinase family protein [Thermoleophilaceae bacterium]
MGLLEAIASETGRAVAGGCPVGGGCINEGWRVDFEDGGRAFVKTRQDVAPGEYATEAEGLRWLAEPRAVRLPEVLAVRDQQEPRFLALEWIDEGRLDAAGAEELGRGLARMHAAHADAFGGPRPLRIGPIALSNEPLADWPSFYAERRLRPLIGPARDNGSLSRTGAEAVERACERMEELSGPPEPPARLHGDLWGGNVLGGADGGAWLIDPAAYAGHREVDLAMLRLFGTPSARIFSAYEEEAPLYDGHEERVGLWQLFPLLVHAVLFGGHYGASVEQTARRYA